MPARTRPVKRQTSALWTCPICHHRFVTRNMSHSCGRHTIDSHFVGKPQHVRDLFDTLVRRVRRLGPVNVYAQKSRIVFQTRGRFVAVTPRQHYLAGHLWLKRRRSHPLIHRVEALLDRDFIHNFRLNDADQLDGLFSELLREAYQVGSQTFEGSQ
jgi:hypothetical protein